MTAMQPPNNKCRLVVVEDSSDDADLLFFLMKKAGIEVRTIHINNGEEALDTLIDIKQIAEQAKSTLVILDLSLPKVTGQEILLALSKCESANKLQIIVFSGSENPVDRDLCIALGASAYYTKPWDFNEYNKFVHGPLKDNLRAVCA